MEEIIQQEKQKVVRIQGDLWEYTQGVAYYTQQGYYLSTKNRHFPTLLMLGVYHCEMLLPEAPVEIVKEESKEPTLAQIRKEELVAALAEKVNLDEQVGMAEVPPEPAKRAGRPRK